VLASRTHWRLLVGTVLCLMAAAYLTPNWVRAPDVDESRVLAQKPAWPERLRDIRAFRTAADGYVADRFPIRPHLIGALNRLRLLAGVSGSRKVIVGRDGWLFHDDDSHLGPARGDPQWPQAQQRAWLLGLAGRTEFLRGQGVPYILFVPPVKETVYPQFGPGWFRLDPDRAAVRMSRLAHETGAGDYLYLHDPIARSAANGVKTYSVHDTHWTGLGAYDGYVVLMRRLQALGLTDGPRPIGDFALVRAHEVNKPRNLALMLGVASFVDVDYPELDDLAGARQVRTTYLTARQDWTSPHVIDTGQAGKPVLLITMDSFSNALMPFLYGHFSRIVVSHNQDGSWRPDLIARFKPDVVVLEVLESGLSFSLDPAPPASADATARIDKVLAAAVVAPLASLPQLVAPGPWRRLAIAVAKPTANCNLEVASLTPDGHGGANLMVSGWLSELAPANTAPIGFVRLQSPAADRVAALRVDGRRPDVAGVFKLATAERSGFLGKFGLPKIAPGDYTPWIYRRSPMGWIACKGTRALSVP